MRCRDCPYGEESFRYIINLYNEFISYLPTVEGDDLEAFILCDKVGGKVSCYGYCDDIQEENISRKIHSNKKKLNKDVNLRLHKFMRDNA